MYRQVVFSVDKLYKNREAAEFLTVPAQYLRVLANKLGKLSAVEFSALDDTFTVRVTAQLPALGKTLKVAFLAEDIPQLSTAPDVILDRCIE